MTRGEAPGLAGGLLGPRGADRLPPEASLHAEPCRRDGREPGDPSERARRLVREAARLLRRAGDARRASSLLAAMEAPRRPGGPKTPAEVHARVLAVLIVTQRQRGRDAKAASNWLASLGGLRARGGFDHTSGAAIRAAWNRAARAFDAMGEAERQMVLSACGELARLHRDSGLGFEAYMRRLLRGLREGARQQKSRVHD